METTVLHRLTHPPWLDSRGLPLSDEELRVVSRSWISETWEQYFAWMEAPGLIGLPLCPLSVAIESAPTAYLKLHANLYDLPVQMQVVLHLRFWESMTIEEIAEQLRKSWEETDALITVALNTLRNSMLGPAAASILQAA